MVLNSLLEYFFYQQIAYNLLVDLQNIVGLSKSSFSCNSLINNAIAENQDFAVIDFKELHALKQKFFK
jgi:hypothetical protein